MLTCQRHLFDLPQDIHYINCAYMAPLTKKLEAIGHHALSKKLRPFTVAPSDFFTEAEVVKERFSQLINAQDKDRIAILPSASYGIANVVKNITLKANENIVLMEEQFPSNVYAWQRLIKESGATLNMVKAPDSANRGEAWNTAILDAINEETKVVCMAHVHWADGTRFDMKAIGKKARECGALFILDGTQSVGALPFDVQELQPDALICAGYKWLLGPYSVGLGYYGKAFDMGVPIEENWINRLDSDNFSTLVNYGDQYRPKANRYSVGEQSNFALLPVMNAALQQLLDWGVGNIQNYCEQLTKEPLQQLIAMGAIIENEAYRGHHLFGVRLPEGVNPLALKQRFAEKNVFVSVRGNAIRVAPHVYNNERDMGALVGCFEAELAKLVR